MSKPLRLYFLCVHNRCRSQIAEAFANRLGGSRVIAGSAGVVESDIHPLTDMVLNLLKKYHVMLDEEILNAANS